MLRTIVKTALVLSISSFLFIPTSYANATEYTVGKGSKVRIDIDHPAKHVVAVVKSKIAKKGKNKGKVIRIKGIFGVNGVVKAGKSTKLSGQISIKLKKLKSGNARRDAYMRAALGIKKQKYIFFSPQSLKIIKMSPKGGVGTITGTFKIRGISKVVTMKLLFKGKLGAKSPVAIIVKGTIKCSDFKVPRPALLGNKIKNVVKLKILIKFKPKA